MEWELILKIVFIFIFFQFFIWNEWKIYKNWILLFIEEKRKKNSELKIENYKLKEKKKMKIFILIISLLIINNSLGYKVKDVDSLSLILATGENQWWSLLDIFVDRMDNVSYDVSENSYFVIEPPLKAVDTSKNYK